VRDLSRSDSHDVTHHRAKRPLADYLAWAAAWGLGVATVYETVVAAGALSIGSVPGEGTPGDELVFVCGFLALPVGAGAALAGALGRHVASRLALTLLAPAGFAFVIARFFGFDPYYAPTLRRYSDNGTVPASWIVALGVSTLLAALLTRVVPRAGAVLTAGALLVCALTAVATGVGH
jgi:hypothetical protein